MSKFKVGDTVYYVSCNEDYDDFRWLPLSTISIRRDIIDEHCDSTAYLLESCMYICLGDLFKSKQECIDAFKKRLDEL